MKRIERAWGFLGWAAVWLIFCLLSIQSGFKERDENSSFKKIAETTTGIVTSAYRGFKSEDDGEPPRIEYRFKVDEREYTGSSEDYVPEGEEVEILFLPSNPLNNQSIGHAAQYEYTFLWSLFCGVFAYTCFALGFSANSHKLIGADSSKIEPQPFVRFPIIICGMLTAFFLFKKNIYGINFQFSPYHLSFIFITNLIFAVTSYIWMWRIFTPLFIALAFVFNPFHDLYPKDNNFIIIYLVVPILMVPACMYIKPYEDMEKASRMARWAIIVALCVIAAWALIIYGWAFLISFMEKQSKYAGSLILIIPLIISWGWGAWEKIDENYYKFDKFYKFLVVVACIGAIIASCVWLL